METFQHIAELIIKHLKNELSAREVSELQIWISQSDANKALFEQFNDTENLHIELQSFYESKNRIWQKIQERLPAAKLVRMNSHRSKVSRWLVAASIFIAVAFGSYFLVFNRSTDEDKIVNAVTPSGDVKAPETSRAMITLADGNTVYLDSAVIGQLAMQGNIKLVKLADGQIVYERFLHQAQGDMPYNTLTNPRGSKVINMTLADGSRVWLNAGSSVNFPVAFVGKERRVNITGEAYFEVTPNKEMPFIVGKGNLQVQVLGTHFNVNAYDNEANIKVTLLEGSVKVSTTKQLNGSIILKPGHQAQAGAEGNLSVTNNIIVDEVMAWKNGIFKMNNTDIGTIMRQLERWYDVVVVYENGIPKGTISGEVPRTLNLSQVLTVYEYSGVEFRIEGKKVIVKK